METLKNPNVNFPVNGLAAIIVTLMLLFFNSSLLKIYNPKKIIDRSPPVFVDYTEPPEPVEAVEPDVITLEPVAPINRDATPDKISRPEIIAPNPIGKIDSLYGRDIPIFKPGINARIPRISDVYNPRLVDQQPRVLRPVTPIYPYQATINGIEGRVVLRFIVDENGEVQNPEVLKAEPEGVFEEAALSAIIKYKFMPATIGKKKVKCIAVMPIGFKIN